MLIRDKIENKETSRSCQALCKEIGCNKNLVQFSIPIDLSVPKRCYAKDLKTVILEKTPKVSEVGSRIDVATTKFELDKVDILEGLSKSIQCVQLMSLDINLAEVDMCLIQLISPIVFESNYLDGLANFKINAMMFQSAFGQ